MQAPNQAELSFHDRASIVIMDILEQLTITEDKIKNAIHMVSIVNVLPSWMLPNELGGLLKMASEIEPLLKNFEENNDPKMYLKAIPEEKMLYFINQVITRLEWVKDGNKEESADQAE